MPQLDIFSYPTQIFWLIVAIIIVYTALFGFILPDVLLIKKIREDYFKVLADKFSNLVSPKAALGSFESSKKSFTPQSVLTRAQGEKKSLMPALVAARLFLKLRKNYLPKRPIINLRNWFPGNRFLGKTLRLLEDHYILRRNWGHRALGRFFLYRHKHPTVSLTHAKLIIRSRHEQVTIAEHMVARRRATYGKFSVVVRRRNWVIKLGKVYGRLLRAHFFHFNTKGLKFHLAPKELLKLFIRRCTSAKDRQFFHQLPFFHRRTPVVVVPKGSFFQRKKKALKKGIISTLMSLVDRLIEDEDDPEEFFIR